MTECMQFLNIFLGLCCQVQSRSMLSQPHACDMLCATNDVPFARVASKSSCHFFHPKIERSHCCSTCRDKQNSRQSHTYGGSRYEDPSFHLSDEFVGLSLRGELIPGDVTNRPGQHGTDLGALKPTRKGQDSTTRVSQSLSREVRLREDQRCTGSFAIG